MNQTLKNPQVVKALPKELVGPYLNKGGQLKWWMRLKLVLWHFYHAWFSNYAKLSKDFAKLVQRLRVANSKARSASRKEPAPSGAVGNGATNFVSNMGAAAAGNVLGHALTDRRNNQKDDIEKMTSEGGGDDNKTGGVSEDPKAPGSEEARGSEGREEQDAHEVTSDAGSDVSDNDDPDQDHPSDAGSDPVPGGDDGLEVDVSDGGGGFDWFD